MQVARFFVHLRHGTDELLDPSGVDLPADRVAAFALRCARDVIAGDVRSGEVDLDYRIDVEDAEGTVVHSLPFADAVRFAKTR